jgi:uncharacterized protein (TIGR02118 family)
MTVAYLLTYNGPAAAGEELRAWIGGEPVDLFRRAAGVESIDLYVPDKPAQDPYLDDGPPPLATLQVGFHTLEDLEALVSGPAFARTVARPTPDLPAGVSAVHEAMDWKSYPVAGQAQPAPLTAPLSYVVRYHRPADDEAAFVKFYVDNHPALLGKLPGIRNVMCYLPLAWKDGSPLVHADYMLGNEVVFDSVAALEAALKSPVRHELREDYRRFPKFTGRNTHFAMQRTRLHARNA